MAALAGTLGFIAANIGISVLASKAPSLGPPYAVPDRVFASPEPLAFWRRDVIWRQQGQIGFGRYDPMRSLFTLVDSQPPIADNMGSPLVGKAARATPAVEKFLAWSQLPMARIERHGCTATVTFGDARFTGPAVRRNFNTAVDVPTGGAGCRVP